MVYLCAAFSEVELQEVGTVPSSGRVEHPFVRI